MGLTTNTNTRIIFSENILAVMLCILYQLFRLSALAMPDMQINHCFDLICQMGLQESLKLFAIQFDTFRQFTHTLNCLQQFLTPN